MIFVEILKSDDYARGNDPSFFSHPTTNAAILAVFTLKSLLVYVEVLFGRFNGLFHHFSHSSLTTRSYHLT
jgi:hypothetical protein